LGLYLAVTLITVVHQMPLNIGLAAPIGSPVGDAPDFYKTMALTSPMTEENLATIRGLWLLAHILCVLISIVIPVYALRALAAGKES
jgi:hypothetical protein